MSYYMYLRKSRKDIEDEQRGEGETLARHYRILSELALKMNIAIAPNDVFKEIVSGDTIAARPKMQEMLTKIEAGGCKGVFVMEVERLARGDTIDQGIVAQTFKYTNTKIISPIKVYDPNDPFDEEYFEFNLFMSRREFSTFKRRLNAGRVAAVKEGRYIANKAPYGYTRAKTDDGKGYMLVPSHEAPVVENIFDWYVNGYHGERLGTTKIAHKLNELGVPARNGGYWTSATIQPLIRNPVYIGKIRWNHRKGQKRLEGGEIKVSRPLNHDCLVTEGLHAPIVSAEIWEKAQDIMSSNRPAPVPRGRTTKNPFAGLLVCGKCGRKMVRRPYRSKQEPSILCSHAECNNVSSTLSWVERKLILIIEGFLSNMLAYKAYPPIAPTAEQEALLSLEKEIEISLKQQENIRTMLEQEVYSVEVYQQRNAAIEATLSNLKARKQHLESIVRAYEDSFVKRDDMIPSTLLKSYSNSTPAQKNELLKTFIGQIVYTREEETRLVERDNFTLEIFWDI